MFFFRRFRNFLLHLLPGFFVPKNSLDGCFVYQTPQLKKGAKKDVRCFFFHGSLSVGKPRPRFSIDLNPQKSLGIHRIWATKATPKNHPTSEPTLKVYLKSKVNRSPLKKSSFMFYHFWASSFLQEKNNEKTRLQHDATRVLILRGSADHVAISWSKPLFDFPWPLVRWGGPIDPWVSVSRWVKNVIFLLHNLHSLKLTWRFASARKPTPKGNECSTSNHPFFRCYIC